MLISDIISELLSETGGDTSDSDLSAVWLTCLKGAIRRMLNAGKSRTLTAEDSISISAGDRSGAVPTDFIEEIDYGIYYVDDSGKRSILTRQDPKDFNENINEATTGVIGQYFIIGKTIYFEYRSNRDRTIFFQYFKDVSGIIAADTFYGTADEVEALKDWAKYTYYEDYQEDTAKADRKKALAIGGMSRIEERYAEKTLQTHVEEA